MADPQGSAFFLYWALFSNAEPTENSEFAVKSYSNYCLQKFQMRYAIPKLGQI